MAEGYAETGRGEKHFCSCVRQSTRVTPKTCFRRAFERTEEPGRRVGEWNSAVEIGTTRRAIRGRALVAEASHGRFCGARRASSRMAVANSYQVVWPAAVMLYVPPASGEGNWLLSPAI